MKLSQARSLLKEMDRSELEELIEKFGEELVAEYQEQGYSVNDMEWAYQGKYRSDEDFARELAGDLGVIDNDSTWPTNCIDWEYAAKELMMDYFEINGSYFRSL